MSDISGRITLLIVCDDRLDELTLLIAIKVLLYQFLYLDPSSFDLFLFLLQASDVEEEVKTFKFLLFLIRTHLISLGF